METRVVAIIYIAIFLVAMIGISIVSGRKKSEGNTDAATEQFLGGRSIPFAVLAISYGASFASSGAFMGDPAVVSYSGYPYMWLLLACMMGSILVTLVIVRKMRIQCEILGVLSPVEYVAARFDSKFMRGFLGLVVGVCLSVCMVAQFKAASVLLNHFTGIDFNVGVFIVAGIVLACTVIGGLRSVAWTDATQGVLMAILCVALMVLGIVKAGGFDNIDQVMATMDPDALKLVQSDMWDDYGPMGFIGLWIFGLFLMPAQPYLTSRYMALENFSKKLVGKYAIVIGIFCGIFMLCFFFGLAGRALFPDAEPDYIVVTLATGVFPPVFSCMVMLAIFASILTTATSMLLTVGQAFGRDFLGVVMPKVSDEKQVKVSNIMCFVVVILIVFFVIVYTPPVLTLVNLIGLTGVGVSLMMPLYMGVLYKNATKEAAICSSVGGICATIAFNTVLLHLGYGVSYGGPALVAALVFVIVNAIVLKTKGNDPKIIALGETSAERWKEVQ